MKTPNHSNAQTVSELISLLKGGKPEIYFTALPEMEGLSDALSVAQNAGYDLKKGRLKDPADPGGCMELVQTFKFYKKSN